MMGFDIEFGFLPQTFFLVLARFAGVITTVPFFGGNRASPMIKVALAFLMALIITPLAPESWAVAAGSINNLPALLLAVFGEVILGAAVGLVVLLFTSIFNVAGDVMSQGAGLMMAKEVDPLSDISNTMIASLLQTTFVLIVVLNNGHLILLKLVAQSFYQAPPQMYWITQNWVDSMIALSSGMMEFGIRLAAPVMGVGFILNMGFALIARIAPDINILFLSMPVRLAATLAVLGLVLNLSGYFFDSTVERMITALAGILT